MVLPSSKNASIWRKPWLQQFLISSWGVPRGLGRGKTASICVPADSHLHLRKGLKYLFWGASRSRRGALLKGTSLGGGQHSIGSPRKRRLQYLHASYLARKEPQFGKGINMYILQWPSLWGDKKGRRLFSCGI